MGATFLATTEAPDGRRMPCMIKRIPSDRVAMESGRRLHDDARVWARLVHPSVVRVLDVGEIDGDAFVAMELVDGCNLNAVRRRCFERRVPLLLESAVHVAGRLVGALAYIHSFEDLHLIHRDVSPDNVLLSFKGEVRLTNFGLAASTLSTHDADIGASADMGSYLSPEQAEGFRLDGRTDIYSAGIIFWELLVGRPLFPLSKGGGWDRNAIRPPSEFDHKVPASLDGIVMKALAVKRERRYQSAAELLADLDAAMPTRQTTAALGEFLAGIFGGGQERPDAIEQANGSRSPAASDDAAEEPAEEIPQPRQVERTVPTNLIKRFLSRLSSRWRRYGVAIVALLMIEIAAAALFFRSSSFRKRRGAVTSPIARPHPSAVPVMPVMPPPPPEPPVEPSPLVPSTPPDDVKSAPGPAVVAIRAPSQGAQRPPRPAIAPKTPIVRPVPVPATDTMVAVPAPLPPSTPNAAPTSTPPAVSTIAPNAAVSKTFPDRVPDRIVEGTDLTARAEEAFRAGLSLDAVRLATKSLGAGGGARAKMVLAEAYFDLRLFEEALNAYSEVLAEQPENRAARVGRDLAEAEATRSREGGRAASGSSRGD